MVPSTKYEFDLDQFDHVSAAVVVLIRPTNPTNQYNAFQEGVLDLYDGQLDHLDVSGTSLYGDGRQVKADYLRKIIAPKYASSQFYGKRLYYPVIFGDLTAAYHGSIHGSYKFDGSKQRLSIETPAVGNGYTRGYQHPVCYKSCIKLLETLKMIISCQSQLVRHKQKPKLKLT